jgi:hypothetical protein
MTPDTALLTDPLFEAVLRHGGARPDVMSLVAMLRGEAVHG